MGAVCCARGWAPRAAHRADGPRSFGQPVSLQSLGIIRDHQRPRVALGAARRAFARSSAVETVPAHMCEACVQLNAPQRMSQRGANGGAEGPGRRGSMWPKARRPGVHSSTGGSNGKLSSSRACRTAVTPLNLSCAHTETFAGGLACCPPDRGGTPAAHREWRRSPVTAARFGWWKAARGTACGITLSTTASLMESECHPAHVIAVELANPQHRSPYASRGRPVLSNADCRLGTHARARRAKPTERSRGNGGPAQARE